MTLLTITLVQLAVMIGYLSYITSKYGVLPSISDSTYALTGNRKFYFLIFCWSLGMLNIFQGMDIYGYYASGGLFFTGVTINHKSFKALTRPVHLVGATSAIAMSAMGLWILYDIWWVTIGVALSIPLLWKSPNRIWWVEIVALILILTAYIIKA